MAVYNLVICTLGAGGRGGGGGKKALVAGYVYELGFLVGVVLVLTRETGFGELLVELSPFLLGPAELLHGGREVEEVNGDDRGPGAQISVPDQGVELPACLDQTGMDRSKSFGLLGGVSVPVAQGALLVSKGRGMRSA